MPVQLRVALAMSLLAAPRPADGASAQVGSGPAPSSPADTQVEAGDGVSSNRLPAAVAAALEEIDAAIESGDLDPARGALRSAIARAGELELPSEEQRIEVLLALDARGERLRCPAEQVELRREVLALRARSLPPEDPDLLAAKYELAVSSLDVGEVREAGRLLEEVLAARAQLLPSDHADLLAAMEGLAITRARLGDPEGASELEVRVVAGRTRSLPPDHSDLLRAMQNLAAMRSDLQDMEGARALLEEVLTGKERVLPSGHPGLLSTKRGLAVIRTLAGDLEGARALDEEVLATEALLLPPDHPQLLETKHHLAVILEELGDLEGSRQLREEVLAVRARLLPPDHPDVLDAMSNLAMTKSHLGDVEGARGLYEAVLAGFARCLPAEHPHVLAAKQNYAVLLLSSGDIEEARALLEEVLAVRTRRLPLDHPDLLTVKQNLAAALVEALDFEGARALLEEVLATRMRFLPPDHPEVLDTKDSLAAIQGMMGDFQGAHARFEELLAARERQLPEDHPFFSRYRVVLIRTKLWLGDVEGARAMFASLLDEMRARALSMCVDAPRSTRSRARSDLQLLLELEPWTDASATGGALVAECFSTLETLRMVSVASPGLAHAVAARPELAELRERATSLRGEINDLAASAPGSAEEIDAWRARLQELARERDSAEYLLFRGLAKAGREVQEVDAAAVALGLPDGALAVSYVRYPRRLAAEPGTAVRARTQDWLRAYAVGHDGALASLELGPAAELEALVRDWRAGLGRPLQGRGVGVDSALDAPQPVDALGRALRERLLDPVLADRDGVSALHVELDDVLFLLPLDALPSGDGLVGDRFAVHNEATLARLLREEAAPGGAGGLLLAGGLDYDAELPGVPSASRDAGTPPVDPASERSGPASAGFAALGATLGEAESIARRFEAAFEQEPVLLSGPAGTKAAFLAAAPEARFLHLATHGWFAPERFRSQLDELEDAAQRSEFERADETLRGFAPETLCGLALSGANRGRDAVGRVPGILTAEELAGLDLSRCELAVLSACETNVGIRRAGQGIQSLQSALHAAGARTAITSLWQVDDAATRRLMEGFYTKLWSEGLGKADALWAAKGALRAEGHPVRDWAAWVLSGDPR